MTRITLRNAIWNTTHNGCWLVFDDIQILEKCPRLRTEVLPTALRTWDPNLTLTSYHQSHESYGHDLHICTRSLGSKKVRVKTGWTDGEHRGNNISISIPLHSSAKTMAVSFHRTMISIRSTIWILISFSYQSAGLCWWGASKNSSKNKNARVNPAVSL